MRYGERGIAVRDGETRADLVICLGDGNDVVTPPPCRVSRHRVPNAARLAIRSLGPIGGGVRLAATETARGATDQTDRNRTLEQRRFLHHGASSINGLPAYFLRSHRGAPSPTR
jgi:hypothetical protein